ncbi:MAG: methionine gamma-lyase family protein, partial [Clostridia bacterium]|nr:methionine gamma-lyase family protein [Clostridia bacterium]
MFNAEEYEIINIAEQNLYKQFAKIDETALFNQSKILDAFRENNVAVRHFAGTNGYGYDDIGRDTLCKIFAQVFGAEAAIVSPLIVSGTHAISLALFGILRPGDTILAISGAPYDTLQTVINGTNNGSLRDLGVKYQQIELEDGDFDYKKIQSALSSSKIKLVFLGRSRGYEWRNALNLQQIEKAADFIKSISPNTIIMCDNCYGEFTDKTEPTQHGVDVIAGSLIKNPGGGIAPTGGYICGKKCLVDLIAARLTAPSIGMEVGSYTGGYRLFYQGLFTAPHTVACAIKSAMLFSYVFSDCNYDTLPKKLQIPSDIICSIRFDKKDEAIEFIRAIQKT